MIRRPPIFPLLPYTTLFRSLEHLPPAQHHLPLLLPLGGTRSPAAGGALPGGAALRAARLEHPARLRAADPIRAVAPRGQAAWPRAAPRAPRAPDGRAPGRGPRALPL